MEVPMDCAIWLNRRKIFSADEISANFDIAAIRGYFLGGSLIKWLDSHGGKEYARLLEKLSPSDPALNDRLTEIFTQKKCDIPVHKADEQLIMTINLLKGGSPATIGSAQGVNAGSGSYAAGSFAPLGYGSFGAGSAGYMLNYGSFRSGSFAFGSFNRSWEWEWEWYLGSFRRNYGSFAYGFGSYAYNFGSYSLNYGSFAYGTGSYRWNLGSFGFGSFTGGSFRRGFTLGSFPFDTSYGMGSYRGFPLGGSFRQVTADEYDEIMYRCLGICPLNRFGYGIHII